MKRLSQRLLKVGQQIFYILDTDGEAQQRIVDASRFADFFWDRAMRHAGGMADQRFHSTKTFRKGEDLEAAHDLINVGQLAPELEGDHATEAAHLPLCQFVIGM